MTNQIFENIRTRLQQYRTHFVVFGTTFTLLFIFLWPSIVISIKPGELGVLYSRFFGGTVLDRTYPEGIHVIPPWDILFIYDVRIQEETQEVDVLTVDGLTVKVQASLRYQLMRDKLPVLHQQIGPEYKKKIILPIMISAVRQTIGSYRPDALYSTARQELQDKMMVDATEEMGRLPILIHGFVVKKIMLPDLLSSAIVDKLVAEQQFLRYNYLLAEAREEAKRKAIEGQGIRHYQMLINDHMTTNFLRYEGIQATNRLAGSNNAKVVVVGGGQDGLPLILNLPDSPASTAAEVTMTSDNASDQNQTNGTNGTETMRTGGDEFDWNKREAEFVDFLQRLDKTLLNPKKRDENTR
jgi:regulator of protease activity HflC (stomatin/prohibitin superfamily)